MTAVTVAASGSGKHLRFLADSTFRRTVEQIEHPEAHWCRDTGSGGGQEEVGNELRQERKIEGPSGDKPTRRQRRRIEDKVFRLWDRDRKAFVDVAIPEGKCVRGGLIDSVVMEAVEARIETVSQIDKRRQAAFHNVWMGWRGGNSKRAKGLPGGRPFDLRMDVRLELVA